MSHSQEVQEELQVVSQMQGLERAISESHPQLEILAERLSSVLRSETEVSEAPAVVEGEIVK